MNLLQPRIVVGVTLIIVFLILISLGQEVNRRWQTQREIQKLETEVHTAQKQVVELQNLNQYFSTDDYQERLAREKLNYQAPGEHVVAVPEAPLTTEQTATPVVAAKLSVPHKWWKRFFEDNSPLTSQVSPS